MEDLEVAADHDVTIQRCSPWPTHASKMSSAKDIRKPTNTADTTKYVCTMRYECFNVCTDFSNSDHHDFSATIR